jgi:L-lactate dehydrogenase complex protein LldG
VRVAQAGVAPHPGRFAPPPRAASFAAFAERLRAIGGEPHGPFEPGALRAELSRLCAGWAAGARVVTAGRASERLGRDPFEPIPEGADPHRLHDVSIAVLEGSHGIVESAAVLLEHRAAPVRALAVLCERLVLLLPERRVVADLHAAMAELDPRALEQPHVTWIAGPSKTADIEQALVHGAHGARALAVVGIAE